MRRPKLAVTDSCMVTRNSTTQRDAALYQQVAIKKNGPDSAFRAYLFTVMRNISARWYREGRLVDPVAEVETVAEDDALSRLEEKTDAEGMLIAFRALPERWQRVLWLVEVDEVPRPSIAQELRYQAKRGFCALPKGANRAAAELARASGSGLAARESRARRASPPETSHVAQARLSTPRDRDTSQELRHLQHALR